MRLAVQQQAADTLRLLTGLLRVIQALLSRSQSAGRSQLALLASERVEHISGGWADIGWSCGYRNAQMLFSSLRHLEAYSHLNDPSLDLPPIPTIKELQNIIEIAWNSGYDPPGAAHFKGKVVGSKKWIGTTEIYTAFVSLGIRCVCVSSKALQGIRLTHFTHTEPTLSTSQRSRGRMASTRP